MNNLQGEMSFHVSISCQTWLSSGFVENMSDHHFLRFLHQVYIVAVQREREKMSESKEKIEKTEEGFESAGESLLSLVQPELSSLSQHWMAALKDHALLSLPQGEWLGSKIQSVKINLRTTYLHRLQFTCSLTSVMKMLCFPCRVLEPAASGRRCFLSGGDHGLCTASLQERLALYTLCRFYLAQWDRICWCLTWAQRG